MLKVLSHPQQNRRAELERIIDEHIHNFIRVAAALATIKQERLWASTHDSFELFCKEKFDACKSYGYELAAAGEVVANLIQSGIPDSAMPSAVAQVRPLAKLPADEQAATWEAARAIAPNSPTAAHVSRAAEAVKAKAPAFEIGKAVTVLDEDSPHYGQQVEVIDVQGVVVQAKTEAGQAVPFLSNELSSERPVVERAGVQPKPKPNPVETLAAELEIERLRCETLEEKLSEAIALLETHAPVAAKAFLASAKELIV
jgi:hypothetical protein